MINPFFTVSGYIERLPSQIINIGVEDTCLPLIDNKLKEAQQPSKYSPIYHTYGEEVQDFKPQQYSKNTFFDQIQKEQVNVILIIL